MLKRLRLKFICINMALVAAMLCAIFGLELHFTRQNLEQESLQMARLLAQEPMRPDWHNTERRVQLPYAMLDVLPDGRIATWGFLEEDTDLAELIYLVDEAEENTGILPEYSLRFFYTATPNGARYVFLDISSQQNTLRNLVKNCVLIGILVLILFLGISILFAIWAVKPVEQAWLQQRQFVADASHELKTPLTVILTNAELLQSPEYDPATKSQFADYILTMAEQMRGLVEGLLELARVDNGLSRSAFTKLDWSQLVENAVLPFEPLYFEQDLALTYQIQPGLFLEGDETRLRQVVDILLDNARKYCSPKGTVSLELQQQGRNHGLLRISNPGAPLSSQELEDIFKRFYRTDRVRSMSHSYGLGLPIARGIVQQHGGKIWAESAHGMITFFVSLPIL